MTATTQDMLRGAAAIVDKNWSAKDDALDANASRCRSILPELAIPPALGSTRPLSVSRPMAPSPRR